jgi:DNA processing protein
MRNAVMSGLAQGTVVVEAIEASGARMQARLAAEHGKRIWLLESLVENFAWAQAFVTKYRSQTKVIGDVSEVVQDLADLPIAVFLPPAAEAEARRRGALASEELTLFG